MTIAFTLLLQAALPIGLVCWLAFTPANSLTGYLAQAIGVGLFLLALKIVALWMLLPWWLPLAYGLLWLVAVVVRIRRVSPPFIAAKPVTISGWAAFAAMIAIGTFAGYLSWQDIQGRQLPEVRVVDIPLPLGPGNYLVAQGGSRKIINAHMMTLNQNVERFRAYRGQSYGIDIVKINPFGFRSGGLQPRDPGAYKIYGQPVYAPCNGAVISSRNDRPDMPVPDMDLDAIAGNYVLLNCDGFVVLLAHFQPGSIRAHTGDKVTRGDHLGAAGNSGKTGEPHLHISAQLPGSRADPLSGQPLAITIDGRYLVRNDLVRK